MNAKLTEHALSLTLVVMLLASCATTPPLIDGQVLSLQPQATLTGLRSALDGAPGTVLLTRGSNGCAGRGLPCSQIAD